MNNQISKNLMCILMRSGIEMWLESDRIENLKSILLKINESKFIEMYNEIINTADISGIYSAETMENLTRRKNGQWQDKDGDWHNKGEIVCKCGNVVPFGKTCGYCG